MITQNLVIHPVLNPVRTCGKYSDYNVIKQECFNNLKHFPIDQYLHDRVTPATLSPKSIAYDKPIDPAEMPRISTCTEMTTEDMNVPTQDDKYPWLDPDDK